MTYLIDTNIFLRVLIREDEASFQSGLRLFEGIKQKDWNASVPGIVLSEIVWTLKSYYQFSKPEVVAAVQSVVNLRGLSIIDDYNYALALEFYQNHSVKYVDACIASLPIVQDEQATIISFDHDFDKLGVSRKEPNEVLMSQETTSQNK